MDVVAVVSNHPDLQEEVARFGVPYHHIPVTKETKAEAEQAQIDLLSGEVELVVMARYMQVLSSNFLDRIGAPVINIHHSFLPAFAGRRALCARTRTRCEADRRDRPLRDGGPRRGADHRAGRGAREPPRGCGLRSSGSAPMSSGSCSRARSPGICRTAFCSRVTVRSSSRSIAHNGDRSERKERPMSAEIIDGTKVAARVREGIKETIDRMPVKPGLATILVGDDPASAVYVGSKRRTCCRARHPRPAPASSGRRHPGRAGRADHESCLPTPR